jgi:hypothetical protein
MSDTAMLWVPLKDSNYSFVDQPIYVQLVSSTRLADSRGC